MDGASYVHASPSTPAAGLQSRRQSLHGDQLRRMILVALLGAILPTSVSAQALGAVAGLVRTAENAPLWRAEVTVAGTSLRAASGEDGSFHISGVAAGAQSIEVRLLGYGKVVLPVEVEAGQTLRLEVQMTAEPVELTGVDVEGEAAVFVSPQMRAFEERRARGSGTFFGREDILRMQPRAFTDVLRRVPGMRINPDGTALTGRTAQLGRMSGCPILYYLNGTRLPMLRDGRINSYVPVEDVIGVEFYNAAQVPAQFNITYEAAGCGVILVWTRAGPERGRSR